MECKFCSKKCIQAGKQKNGQQRYFCKVCRKYQQGRYKYAAYNTDIVKLIPALVRESISIRGIGRLLKIGLTTVIRKIKAIAKNIIKPAVPIGRKAFELDELRTYIRNKEN